MLMRKMSQKRTATLAGKEGVEEPVILRTSPELQRGVRSELLLAIEQDTAKNVRRKVADTISVLAAAFLAAGQWPELLPKVVEWVSPGSRDDLRRGNRRAAIRATSGTRV